MQSLKAEKSPPEPPVSHTHSPFSGPAPDVLHIQTSELWKGRYLSSNFKCIKDYGCGLGKLFDLCEPQFSLL